MAIKSSIPAFRSSRGMEIISDKIKAIDKLFESCQKLSSSLTRVCFWKLFANYGNPASGIGLQDVCRRQSNLREIESWTLKISRIFCWEFSRFFDVLKKN